MKEIKFRATYKPQWGEVGLFPVKQIDWDERLVDGEIPINCVELMQYTGLKDKNGKEIYEGDIVRDNDEGAVGVIQYDLHGSRFALWESRSTPTNISAEKAIDDYGFVCIGNVHENPDLLKV